MSGDKFKNIALSPENLDKIYQDYWDYDSENHRHRFTVTQIIQNYSLGDLRAHNLPKLLIEKGYNRLYEICPYCGKDVFKKSRSETWTRCDCGFRGKCIQCGEPYKDRKEDYCFKCWVESYNNLRLQIEAQASTHKPNRDEELLLNIFTDKREEIFPNDELDIAKISFLLKRSVKFSNQLLETATEKGFIREFARLDDNNRIRFIVGEVLIPINKIEVEPEKRISPVILSAPAKEVFIILLEKFPYVFAEVPSAAIVKFNAVRDALDENERRWFFTARFDFVCTNEDFIPTLVVEYNGDYHFVGGPTDSIKRRFKRRVCDLVGIPVLELNSYKQIRTRLEEYLGKLHE